MTKPPKAIELFIVELEVRGKMLDGQKQEWAQEHASRIQKLFEQWQQPLGIDGSEYAEYLRDEYVQCCDNPLLKELIESIS